MDTRGLQDAVTYTEMIASAAALTSLHTETETLGSSATKLPLLQWVGEEVQPGYRETIKTLLGAQEDLTMLEKTTSMACQTHTGFCLWEAVEILACIVQCQAVTIHQEGPALQLQPKSPALLFSGVGF